jgi:hypothetical protein
VYAARQTWKEIKDIKISNMRWTDIVAICGIPKLKSITAIAARITTENCFTVLSFMHE